MIGKKNQKKLLTVPLGVFEFAEFSPPAVPDGVAGDGLC